MTRPRHSTRRVTRSCVPGALAGRGATAVRRLKADSDAADSCCNQDGRPSVARETGKWVALGVPEAPGAIMRHELGQQEALFPVAATGIVGRAEQAGALDGRGGAIVPFGLDP